MFFVSSLNTVSSSRVQHNTYAFSLHIQFKFLPKEKGPQDLPCYSKERGPIQMFPIFKSAQSIYAGIGQTHINMLILEE